MTIYLTNGTVLTFKDANCVVSMASDAVINVRRSCKDGEYIQIATFYKVHVMGWNPQEFTPAMRTP